MELNSETTFILGRPNFWCHPIADRLRRLGHEIERKAEIQQAHVINLMLEYYEKYGTENWRKEFEHYLNNTLVVR